MTSVSELVGRLAQKSDRLKNAQKLAKAVGAEEILIFIKDKESGIFLPAPGFPQTVPGLYSWRSFLEKCIKSKTYTGSLSFKKQKIKKNAAAISCKGKLVVVLIGGNPSSPDLLRIYDKLSLLAVVLEHEQYQEYTQKKLQMAEKSLAENKETIIKLRSAHQKLQTSPRQIKDEIEVREKTVKELVNQRQRLSELFMKAPAIIAVLRGPKHVFELTNPLYTKLIGGRDVVGMSIRKALPELEGQGIYELLDKVYRTGKPFIGNEVLVKIDKTGHGKTEDGYYNFVYEPSRNTHGRVNGILVHAVDVTEQVLTRKRVQASEERLRFIAESMPQKIFTASPSGEIDYFNPQWAEFTGLSLPKILKGGWKQFIHPDDIDENAERWKNSIATGEPFQIEHRFRRYDGIYHWHLSRAHALRNKKGKIVMWAGSNTDIEDSRRIIIQKEELEKSTVELKRQRKQLLAINRSKDEFISLASHQLRTPATGVKQYIGMIIEGYAGDITPDQREFLEQAYLSNERQLKIVDDLLKVARIDSGQIRLRNKSSDLVALIKDVLNEQSMQLIERQQHAKFIHKNPIQMLEMDAEKIRMVLENLIDNASKYTHTGKNITVTLNRDKNAVSVAVKDEGVGVARKDLSKLFQKFSRLDNELSLLVGGTGLGLYWAKRIIDLHSGSITVNSDIDQGSTFTITLPVKPKNLAKSP